MNNNQVIQIANRFCEENEITTYPVRIVDLCKKFGFLVYEEYLPKDVSGFIVVQKEKFNKYDSGKVIVVNLSDSASRRRFTTAHELAHFILHKQPGQDLFAHRDAGQNGKIEQEANIFASNLLMPESLIREAINMAQETSGCVFDSYAKINCVAQEFAVSKPAARVRLNQLGLIYN